MKCPYCNHPETKVVDSRESEDTTRRRRECESCTKRFTTYERVENLVLNIIKKDGRKDPFNREKLRKGIAIAGQKRLSEEKIDEITDDIEIKLRAMDEVDIDSKKVGELVMKSLKKIDKVAYIRFASVYKEFADVDEIKDEIEMMSNKGRK